MKNGSFRRVSPELYERLHEVADLSRNPHAQAWLSDIEKGIRMTYAYEEAGRFLGEVSLVTEIDDPDYVVPRVRAYFSHLLVKEECRGRGIGKALVDFICAKAKALGYREISLGVDKDNDTALHLYRAKGFDRVLYEGEDEYGPFYKLLKTL